MHARFCSGLTHRYFIRAHMTVMLSLVLILSGVFGYEAHKRCPGSFNVRQVFRNCILG